MHLILIKVSKCKVHVTPKVRKYITPISKENKLIKLNKEDKLTLIKVECNKVILSKFKTVKFIA